MCIRDRSKIYEADPNFAQKLYEKNFPAAANLNPVLSASENEYVNQKGAVTVAVPRDWHPLLCLNNSDEHEGLAADILKEISDYSGLQFTYLYCDTYAQALDKLQQEMCIRDRPTEAGCLQRKERPKARILPSVPFCAQVCSWRGFLEIR